MNRIYGNLMASRALIIWLVIIGSGFAIKAIVEHKLNNLPVIIVLMFCWVAVLEILSSYFSYIISYPDNSFKVVVWFYRRSRIYPKYTQAIGVARTLDKKVKELFVVYKNKKEKKKELVFSIAGYGSYNIAKLLSEVCTANAQISTDNYCRELIDKYHTEPSKLEKNWQEKFKFKWPLPQWITDIMMFLLLLLCIYLFFHISTLHGWCWGKNNCFSSPII